MPSVSVTKTSTARPRNASARHGALLIAVHIFCLCIYLVPILRYDPPTDKHGGPVLDELHIASSENGDVVGDSDWTHVFRNDYWGRPMNSESSHKSWRPLSVLSFRWLQLDLSRFARSLTKLNLHRVVNVVTHAAAAECVSILAVQLFRSSSSSSSITASSHELLGTRILTKLLFALHPTHVEVTANAANRPHILAVLCSCVLSDGNIPIALFILLGICGFLTSETFIFQLPAIVLTMTLIRITQREQANQRHVDDDKKRTQQQPAPLRSILLPSLKSLLPRYILLFLLACTYLVGRYYFDTLSIPDGLIRPAENPFYEFEGWHRVRNYAFVVAIHLCKSMFVDIIGFSHEYGFDCIAELKEWSDVRLLLPFGLVLVFGVVAWMCWQRGYRPVLLFLWHLSFGATLFPISGVVKVGTFVADRIVVASTVSVSMLVGAAFSRAIVKSKSRASRNTTLASLLVFVLFLWNRVHTRTLQWMDSEALLHSSLRTCPRSAKSHVEVSKIYSGLYPEQLNLSKSLFHLSQAESIDPDFCDVHQQFAHVYIQQQRYREFEERLYHGILCPFSMGGSVEMWRRYWQAMIPNDPSAKQRMEEYNKRIQRRVEEETHKAETRHGSKHWSTSEKANNDDEL